MKTEKEKLSIIELEENLKRLQKAANLLANSYRKCKAVGIKQEYSDTELETFDAYTSRFARVSNILTQRIFKLIDILEYEESTTFLDVVNRAEKREIINSSLLFKEIREIRNEIAHEYALRNYDDFMRQIIALTPSLLDSVDKVILYSSRFK
jgi:hypothetical protein